MGTVGMRPRYRDWSSSAPVCYLMISKGGSVWVLAIRSQENILSDFNLPGTKTAQRGSRVEPACVIRPQSCSSHSPESVLKVWCVLHGQSPRREPESWFRFPVGFTSTSFEDKLVLALHTLEKGDKYPFWLTGVLPQSWQEAVGGFWKWHQAHLQQVPEDGGIRTGLWQAWW